MCVSEEEGWGERERDERGREGGKGVREEEEGWGEGREGKRQVGKGRRGSGERKQERSDRAVEMAIDLMCLSHSRTLL